MGQKVNPIGLRLNMTRKWESRWFANKKDFAKQLDQDNRIRQLLRKKFPEGAIKNIVIFRNPKIIEVTIHTAKPGIIIGSSGSGMNDIRKVVEAVCQDHLTEKLPRIKLHVEEVRGTEVSAYLVAEGVANQIAKRVNPRRSVKMALDKLKEKKVAGAKIRVSGRLGGAEIARSESLGFGSIPLHTIRKNIDYSHIKSLTSYGTIGVKVWLNLGDSDLDKEEEKEQKEKEKRKSN